MAAITFNELIEKLANGDLNEENIPVVKKLLREYDRRKNDGETLSFDLDKGVLIPSYKSNDRWANSGCSDYDDYDWNSSSC